MADDRWPDDMIRLLRERAPGPTAAETAAYICVKIAEYSAYIFIAACIALAWIMTP